MKQAVQTYLSKGLSVIPLNGKIPAIKWTGYQKTLTSKSEAAKWFDGTDKNIGIVTGELSGLSVVDFDTEEAYQDAKKRGLPHGPTVKTGRGYHLYCQHQDGLRNFQKRDDLPGIDLRAEGGQVVAPPSIHQNGKKYEWLVTFDEAILPTVPEWLIAKPTEKKPIKELYSGSDTGSRNDTLARLLGSWVNDGGAYDDVLQQALIWNESNKPPLPRAEIEKTVKSIFDTHHRNKPTEIKSRITFTDIAHAIANPVEITWLIDGLIEAKTTGAIFGESTSGKSFVAVDLAACVATGAHWIGHRTENTGIALYFAGEGRHGLPRRFKAWQEEHDLIIPENRLFLPGSRVEVAPSGVRLITMAIDELPDTPELIIIDTVARSLPSGSDENSAKDMMEFINAIDEIRDHYGCVIALIHHTGHSETARTRARGSSAFRAAMDWEILVDKKKSQIRCTKMKDAEIPPPVHFEIVSVGQSAVIEYGNEIITQAVQSLTRNEELGLKTLKAACEIESRAWASLDEWRQEFYRRHTGDNQEAKRKAFSRTRTKLSDLKRIIVDSDTYRPTSGTKRDKAGQCPVMSRDKRDTPYKGVPNVPHNDLVDLDVILEVVQ